MKRHAFLVGAFVLLALALAVAGVLTLNKSGLFTQRNLAVVYFGGSVKGLYVGAPVTLRGVKMGEVTHIGIEVDPATLVTRIPVTLTLSVDALQMASADEPGKALNLPKLVNRGLRARLILQSIVTGQTAVELDFRPDSPSKLVAGGRNTVPEIPTVQDKLDVLINQLQNLPLGDLMAELRQTLTTLNDTLKISQTAIANSSKQLDATGAQARQTLAAATQSLQSVQTQANATLASIQQLSDTTRSGLVQAQPVLQQTLVETRQAAESAKRAMQDLAELSAPGSPLRSDMDGSVNDLSQAARSLRSFADQLDRNPSSLIFGVSKP